MTNSYGRISKGIATLKLYRDFDRNTGLCPNCPKARVSSNGREQFCPEHTTQKQEIDLQRLTMLRNAGADLPSNQGK